MPVGFCHPFIMSPALKKLLCVAALLCSSVYGSPMNYTLDDTSPTINYTQAPLLRCAPGICDAPWTARLFQGTSAITAAPIVVPFTGSAVYVYLGTLGTCMFSLDGVVVGAYAGDTSTSDADDIRLAYWATGLPNSAHVLTIYPAKEGQFVQLDYIIYTHASARRNAHFAAIIGGVLGSGALVGLLSLVVFLVRRREKRRQISMRGIPLGDHWPDQPRLRLALDQEK
ncbi:hypothetical protein DFH09DRAFT_1180434 [Mycena vulgaris]|nr:hypothetical protein DFH09DRAFT_1180434 [Mycena vulgaris]